MCLHCGEKFMLNLIYEVHALYEPVKSDCVDVGSILWVAETLLPVPWLGMGDCFVELCASQELLLSYC